ncbi:uncharacterized protein M6B38_273075 [Iris pallida]|uniref:Uncharacterized protein n=1 Tax=Iris pallida TaxID=29817 RepID=A0AAX6I4H5_IRIPA|nr:uncharacterized protein M6B38_273075 [Iris pallida]
MVDRARQGRIDPRHLHGRDRPGPFCERPLHPLLHDPLRALLPEDHVRRELRQGVLGDGAVRVAGPPGARDDRRRALLEGVDGAEEGGVPVRQGPEGRVHVHDQGPPAVRPAVGEVLRRPRRALLGVRAQPAGLQAQCVQSLRFLRPPDPQRDGQMGNCRSSRCRETSPGKRAAGLLQRALRAPLRELHSRVQLPHRLQVPHELGPQLRRLLRRGLLARPGPLQQPHEAGHPAQPVEEGVRVVRAQSRAGRRHSRRHQVLLPLQEVLQALMLPRRALHPHLPEHVPWALEREPERDVGGLVQGRRPSGDVRPGERHGGLHPVHQEQRHRLHLQLQADLRLFPLREEVRSRRAGAPARPQFDGDAFLSSFLCSFLLVASCVFFPPHFEFFRGLMLTIPLQSSCVGLRLEDAGK